MPKVIDVHIGQIKIARNGQILKAILGSCVGVGAIHARKNLCALAHCLLPKSTSPTYTIGGRYVDQAFKSILALLKVRASDIPDVSIIIAGGGNMTGKTSSSTSALIGEQNSQSALKEAEKYGLNVTHSEIGGNFGRIIYVNSESFSYKIENIPRLTESHLIKN